MNKYLELFAEKIGFVSQKGLKEKIDSALKEAPQYRQAGLIQLPVPPERRGSELLDAYKSWVFACINARAGEVSNIEPELFRRKGSSLEPVEEHAILNLLFRWNRHMTQSQGFEAIQSFLDLSGEAFVWKARNGKSGPPLELWLLRPDWVEVVPDKDKFVKGYIYNPGGVKGQEIPFDADEILHIKYFNPKNPYRGLGVVKAAALEIDTHLFAGEWNRNFFYNAAQPSGVLEVEGTLKDEVFDRIKSQWEERHRGKNNAHKIAILEGGTKFNNIGFNQKDMDFAQLKTSSRDDILGIFRVPKSLVAISDDVNRANAREHRAVFLEFVVDGLMKRIMGFLNEFLVPDFPDGKNLILSYKNPVPSDVAANLKYYESGLNQGWLTQNEVRHEEGLEPFKDKRADAPMVPFNVVFLEPGQPIGNEPTKGLFKKRKGPHGPVPPRPIAEKIAEDVQNILSKSITGITGVFAGKDSDLGIIRSRLKALAGQRQKEVEAESKKKDKLDLSNASLEDLTKLVNRPNMTEEQRRSVAKFWKDIVDISELHEKELRDKVRRLFLKQEGEVIARVEAGKVGKSKDFKAISDVLFNQQTELKLWIDVLTPVLEELIRDSGKSTLEFVNSGESFDFGVPAVARYLRTDGAMFMRSVNQETASQLSESLAQGIEAGESIGDLAHRVRMIFANATVSRSELIARTETIRGANFATEQAYRQIGVEKKEWLTALDDLVCPWCAPLDGKVISINDSFFEKGDIVTGTDGRSLTLGLTDTKYPPLHPNCRCTLIPVVE